MKRTCYGFYRAGAHPITSALMVIMVAFCSAYPGWTRIGLDGMRVTSITAGKVWSDTMLFAGTDSGVFYKAGSGAFQSLTSPGSAGTPAGPIHVRSLYLPPGRQQLFAGSDSGLYSYHFTSGLPPAWFKISGIYGSVVSIVGSGDTIAAASPMALHRSFDGGTAWAPCTLSFNRNKHPVYTSLAVWNGINAGSDEWFGDAPPWVGVSNSPDFGHTWNDISNLPGQAQPLKAVYCLAIYRTAWNTPLRLVAGTTSGIQWVDNLDTGTWRPLESQLTMAPARHIYCTTYSWSFIPTLFASTDSGIFTSTPNTQSGQWQRTLQKRAYGVTSLATADPKEWFAAVEDGVYRYDEGTPARTRSESSISSHDPAAKTRVVANSSSTMKNNRGSPLILYAISGKKLGTIAPGGVFWCAPSGIVITMTENR